MKKVFDRSILLGLFLIGTTSSASASSFSVKDYDWCMGPLNPGAPCSTPYSWQGVNMGEINTVSFDQADPKLTLSLASKDGVSWSVNLAECTATAPSPTGCRYTIDSSNPGIIQVTYHKYISNWQTQDFSIWFNTNNTEIDIFGPPNGTAMYVLNVTKIK